MEKIKFFSQQGVSKYLLITILTEILTEIEDDFIREAIVEDVLDYIIGWCSNFTPFSKEQEFIIYFRELSHSNG